MASTGGTAFPSGAPTVRSQAVQRVTGGKAPARYLNKASGRMETAQAMKAFRMPQQHSAPARAPQHMPSANKGGQNHAQTGQGGSEQAQLHHLATKQIQQATHTELEPYKNKAAELTQYEGTAAKRLAGYAGKTDELLGGIQSGAQAAGKTFANQAAEAALKAQNSVNQDQTLTAQGNGGYLDPQVKAALENQRANITGIGAARGSNAETLGQAESNFMTNIRAAAGQRALEGQGNVASRYGQQQTANSQAENSLIARQPERITGRESQLAKEAFTRKATEQGLGIKIQGLEQKGKETEAHVKATERGQNISRANTLSNIKQREHASRRTRETAEKDTTARIEAQVAKGGGKTASGKILTPQQRNTLSTELGRAYQGFVSGRSGKEKLTPAEIRENLILGKEGKKTFPKATNQALITAAQELYYTHKVSKATRKLLGDLGMNIGYDNEAFRAVSGK